MLIKMYLECVYNACDLKQINEKGRAKRVQATFTEEQWSLMERFRGIMGNRDAEIIRNVVLAWLAEKSVVSESVKKRFRSEKGEGE